MRRIIKWAGLLVFIIIIGSFVWGYLLNRGPAGPVIAIIEIRGLIQPSSGERPQSTGGLEGILWQIEQVEQDNRVGGVVVRIESSGGTPAASQEVYSRLRKLREKGLPVVASLGEVATSGGYYVALAADRIVANPATLTGSIGVRLQLVSVAPLAENLGIEVEELATGEHKLAGSPFQRLTPAQREVLEDTLQDLHRQFVEAVAHSRGLSVERVNQLADGRVYTGSQAVELGLVDDLGGLADAVSLAASLAGLDEDTPTIRFRPPARLWERLLTMAEPAAALEHLLPGFPFRYGGQAVPEHPQLHLYW